MIAAPQYQFVRINEEGAIIPDCYTQTADCLPISLLSDLKFQMVTNFQADPGEGQSRIVAIACQSCNSLSDEEILQMAFGVEERGYIGSGENDGNLTITPDSPFTDLQAGDWVQLSLSCTVGCTHDYQGVYQVVQILSGVSGRFELNTDFEGFIDTDPITITHLVNQSYLLGDTSFAIPDDSEFEGDNYLWNIAQPLNANPDIDYADLTCFSLCIYRATKFGELTDVECLGMSNCFQKVATTCYTSKLTYGCNENAFGFYTDGVDPFEISIRLPLYLHSPQLPGEEKGYQKSDGSFVKLAERVNKTWELETDYMPDEWHERLRMALSCDNIEITNENVNLVDEQIYRSEPYELDPNGDIKNYPFWKGRTKVFKKLLSHSLNSNCV